MDFIGKGLSARIGSKNQTNVKGSEKKKVSENGIKAVPDAD